MAVLNGWRSCHWCERYWRSWKSCWKNVEEYDFEIEAHPKWTKEDIVEAIEANFYGTLDDENVEKSDKLRYLLMKKIESQLDKWIENELKCIHTVIVEVKENELVRKVIDGWKERY